MYNDHPWDPKMMVVVDRVSVERSLLLKSSDWDLKMVVARDKWSFFGGASWHRFDCTGNCYYSMLSFHLIYFDIASSYITQEIKCYYYVGLPNKIKNYFNKAQCSEPEKPQCQS